MMNKLRKYIASLTTVLSYLAGANSVAHAQDNRQVNDLLFQQVKILVNGQKSDSLYSLLNDNFKAKFSREKFTTILASSLYPLGRINEASFMSYDDGTSSYKATMENAILEFRVRGDKNGKIDGLRFLQYQEPAALKNEAIPTDNPMRSPLDSAVDKAAKSYINRKNAVGLSIGILQNGKTTFYAYGSTDKNKHQLPGNDAVFEIGSITKTFTSTLLAWYVVQHKLSLSDAITRYLPDSVAANAQLQGITLKMLANHTSGMPRIPANLLDAGTDMNDPYKDYSPARLYDYLERCSLDSRPGEKFAYSNLGAGLLGNILERVSGKTYSQMVAEIICKPLELTSTFQSPDAEQKIRQVSVYNDKGEQVVMWDIDALAGAGALRSTTHDLLLYAAANMETTASPLSKAIALTHGMTYDKEESIGLGWVVTKGDNVSYWHNGGTGGSSSFMAFDPNRKVAVVVLSNSSAEADPVGQDIFRKLTAGSNAK